MAAKNSTDYVHTVTIDGDTKKITLKNFGRVPAGLIRRNRKQNEEAMWAIIEWGVVSDDDLAAFDELPLSEVEDMFTAWQEASQVSAGESSGSSAS